MDTLLYSRSVCRMRLVGQKKRTMCCTSNSVLHLQWANEMSFRLSACKSERLHATMIGSQLCALHVSADDRSRSGLRRRGMPRQAPSIVSGTKNVPSGTVKLLSVYMRKFAPNWSDGSTFSGRL